MVLRLKSLSSSVNLCPYPVYPGQLGYCHGWNFLPGMEVFSLGLICRITLGWVGIMPRLGWVTRAHSDIGRISSLSRRVSNPKILLLSIFVVCCKAIMGG